MRELVSSAIADKLRATSNGDKPWLESLGKLRGLHKETLRVNKTIEDEFGRGEREDRR